MKKTILSILIGAGLIFAGTAVAATLMGYQGGTGLSSASSTSNGYYLQVASTSPWLTYQLAPVSGGSSSTVSLTGSSTAFYFPYWINNNGGLSTSSPIFVSSSTGNVGIGTTAPNTALDVNGAITDRNVISSPFLATNVTGTIIAGTVLGTANGGTATTTALGSNAFSSVAYYPNSNPSGFISTDQYWTGTATNLVAATGRTSLGLGTMATQSVPSAGIVTSNGTTISSTATPLSAANGGTATTTALGTAAFTASSSYLPAASSTYFPSVATTTVVKYDIAPTITDQIPFVVSANPLTIKRVLCYQDNSGDTVTFQLIHGSTNVFSTGQTCTAVRSSPLILTSFTSASVAAGETVYLTMSAASSSAVSFQVEY
jgi:hypothetical protein